MENLIHSFVFRDRLLLSDVRVQRAFEASDEFHDSYLVGVSRRRGYVVISLENIYFVSQREYNICGISGVRLYAYLTTNTAEEVDFFSDLSDRDVYRISVDIRAQTLLISFREVYDFLLRIDISRSYFRWRFSSLYDRCHTEGYWADGAT